MKQRVISGFFVALVILGLCFLPINIVNIMLALIIIQASREVASIFDGQLNLPIFFVTLLSCLLMTFSGFEYGFYVMLLELLTLTSLCVFTEKVSFQQVAISYILSILIGFGLYFIYSLKNVYGPFFALYLFVLCSMCDIFAFFVGKALGKHKLNERISPHKTIEGAIGGWLLSAIISFAYLYIFNFLGLDVKIAAILCLLMPLVSQLGDLIFSMIKRALGIKDFSNFIPGHGGILDRMDSSLITAIVMGLLLNILI